MKTHRWFVSLVFLAGLALFLGACTTPPTPAAAPEASSTALPSLTQAVNDSRGPAGLSSATAPPAPSATSLPLAESQPVSATPEPEREPTASPTPFPTLGAGSVMISSVDLRPMVLVPAGNFLMGAGQNDPDADADERPQHTVTLDAFWIDQFEVTNEDYAACMQAGACEAPADEDYNGFEYADASLISDAPVVNVTWFNARDYCAWANKRLPTEAEWEKAARGEDGRIYPWGDDSDAVGRAWFGGVYNPEDPQVRDDFSRPAPVGSFPDGASPYGANDMAGNVLEWISDWYANNYSDTTGPNPTGADDGSYRVVRGGGWTSPALQLRSTYRLARAPVTAWIDTGFRCALPAEGNELLYIGQPTSTPTLTNTPRPTYTPSPTPTAPTPTALPANLSLYALVFAGEDGMIYTVNSDGSGLKAITDGSIPYSSPAWSPVANTIAAFGPRDDDYGRSIWLMAPDGSKVRKMFNLPLGQQQFEGVTVDVEEYMWLGGLQWSPDASRLVFQSVTDLGNAGISFNVHVVSSSGSGFATARYAFQPAWSPSNNQIAFVSSSPYLDEFSIVGGHVGLNGEYFPVVGGYPGGVALWLEPDWSPDGRHVVFVYNENPDSPVHALMIVPVGTGYGQERLYPAREVVTWVAHPTWSPGGDEIAFMGSENILYAIRPDGTGLRAITPSFEYEQILSISWSPDGTRLALTTASQELYVVNADGTGLVLVATGLEPAYDLDWPVTLTGMPQWSPWPVGP